MTMKNYLNKRYPSDFVGPPIQKASVYILARIQRGCKVCAECGEPWHWDVRVREGAIPQINVCGQLLAIRRAVYLLKTGHQPPKGCRATSRCRNPHCCDPAQVVARHVSLMVSDTYRNGSRNAAEARAHLYRYSQRNTVKLQPQAVAAVRADHRPAALAARDHGITEEYFRRIHTGRARMNADLGMFSGLVTTGRQP